VQKPNPVGENRMLQRTNAADLAQLQPNLRNFSMELGAVLHAPGASIKHVYFPLRGMVSLLAVMRTGELIETAIVGREGVVGASVGTGVSQSAGQATVQIAGSAWRIEAPKFLDLYQSSVSFRTLMNKFQNVILLQTQQSAACHALHAVEARLCRWLLQSQDVTDSDVVPLTQEFLSHMLGVRRSSVSLCAHALQTAGLIRYSRGQIEIQPRRPQRLGLRVLRGHSRAYR
jgi:CRP-like cAMP-binding protein